MSSRLKNQLVVFTFLSSLAFPAVSQVNNPAYADYLLVGLTTRWAAGMSLFILLNLAIGGYYDASLIPFFVLNLLFLTRPSGQWLGIDQLLAKRV